MRESEMRCACVVERVSLVVRGYVWYQARREGGARTEAGALTLPESEDGTKKEKKRETNASLVQIARKSTLAAFRHAQ